MKELELTIDQVSSLLLELEAGSDDQDIDATQLPEEPVDGEWFILNIVLPTGESTKLESCLVQRQGRWRYAFESDNWETLWRLISTEYRTSSLPQRVNSKSPPPLSNKRAFIFSELKDAPSLDGSKRLLSFLTDLGITAHWQIESSSSQPSQAEIESLNSANNDDLFIILRPYLSAANSALPTPVDPTEQSETGQGAPAVLSAWESQIATSLRNSAKKRQTSLLLFGAPLNQEQRIRALQLGIDEFIDDTELSARSRARISATLRRNQLGYRD